MQTICKICGNTANNRIHIVKERILNNGETFHYLECAKCKSWMMIDDVKLNHYYPQNYNPYLKKNDDNFIDKIKMNFLIKFIIYNKHRNFDKILKLDNVDILFKRLCGTKIKKDSSILDVGCANGHWLDILSDIGYKDITGVDLFMPSEKMKNKKWTFVSGDIFSVNNKKYDFIALNHSLEHMNDPFAVLKKINSLLEQNGLCMISIPLAGGTAHKKYGEYFCQLDAPRHLYLLSRKAMYYLCRKAGLRIEYVSYDSHHEIFTMSEGYRNTVNAPRF